MSINADVPRRHLVIGGALGALAAAAAPGLAQVTKPASKADSESLDALKALFDAYFKAFSAQDGDGVVALFAPDAIIVGTGPGEIWGGPEEIREAHKNFFQGFDPGKQRSEPLFRHGNVVGDMAWLMSMSKVTFTKGTGVTEFGLNSSVVFEKTGGKWLVRAMHFSNLTSAAKS